MLPSRPLAQAAAAAPCVLAIDTSTECLALGLAAAAGRYTQMLAGGAAASARLLPQAVALLERAGLGWADIDCIAFGRGPGAFTGLRTACAVAQGLGLALDRPLLPLDSLLVVAEDARLQARPDGAGIELSVLMDARMDEVYAGRYRWHAGVWQTLLPPALYSLPALEAAWADLPPVCCAGSALSAFGDRLPVAVAGRVAVEANRADALLRLAEAAAAAGDAVDAAQALPLYLRDKVALTTLEREAVRLAKAASP